MVLPSISFRNPVVHLDKNTLRFLKNYTEASVYTVNGRVTVGLRPGKFQQSLLAGFMAQELAGTSKENRIFKLGECNLVWKCGIKGRPSRWELHITIEKKLKEVSLDNLSLNQVMGVDVGENLSALQCHRNTAQAPICLQELWLQSAQRPQWRTKSATSGLSADNPGAGVNKPYV